ncbi:MAG: class I SAM-dependent DNA methyltransferase [Saprospiraceae bacterium]
MRQPTMFETTKEALGYEIGGLLRPVLIGQTKPENPEDLSSISEWLALEKAMRMDAQYVYFRRFENRPSQPLFYVYDYSEDTGLPDEDKLGRIQKDIWSSAEVPCALVFAKDSVSIINTSREPNYTGESFTPTYLLKKSEEISEDIKERFSSYQLLSGEFWNAEKDHFAFSHSAHKTLLDKLRAVREAFLKEDKRLANAVNRLLIQCVLIRYLEAKQDLDASGNLRRVFPEGFFEKISGVGSSFKHALETGTFWEVFNYLNQQDHLNGKIFDWTEEEKKQIQAISSDKLVNLLYETRSNASEQLALWDLYSFRYLPVEIVSSIYEALFSNEESVQEDGMVYTPPHLAAFLVDEAMPLNAWKGKKDFKVLDPSCGSGVFLVLTFKRLVHWWRLQNNGSSPDKKDIINILRHSIHGVDLHDNAILLTRFSLCLAVCDMLTPPEIWDALQFPDLEGQLVGNDFFDWYKQNQDKKATFDLVIGNPPFVQASKKLPDWKTVSDFAIPQKQIALYFMSAGMRMVKPKGLLCLLIKSSSFLYTSSGGKYRTNFLLHNQVHQVLDFTLLAESNVLWPSQRPDTAAVFATPGPADTSKKILHVVLRRSPTTKTKRYFEIDAYDLNWVPYIAALQDDFVWKTNLLGGGRLYGVVKYLKTFPTLGDYFEKAGWICGEGYEMTESSEGELIDYINDKPWLPYEWLTPKGIIATDKYPVVSSQTKFSRPRDKKIYTPPHILFRKITNDEFNFSIAFSEEYLTFPKQIVGINAPDSQRNELFDVFQTIITNGKRFHGLIYSTSPRCLVIKNTSFNPDDIYQLPYDPKLNIDLAKADQLVLDDVVNHYQDFIRHPDSSKSKAFHPITSKNLQSHFTQFGSIFCESLNAIYCKGNLRFRQAEIGTLHFGKFIYTTFCYDDQPEHSPSPYGEIQTDGDLTKLLTLDKGHTQFQRIQKIYKKDYVCFIKPNQFRYWLDSIALRDADWVLTDLVAQGH